MCPVSLDLVRPHLADLRRTTSPETPSRRPSHLIWSVRAILSAVSHSIWSAMAILSGEVDGDRGGVSLNLVRHGHSLSVK
jgi:hypothetical protein